VSDYFAFSGGLITGIFAPLSGGGTLMSESRLFGGQITPSLSASFFPSGAPFALGSVPLFGEGVQFCADLDEGGGAEFSANADTLVSNRRETGVAICANFFIRS
jgi:hypothetical protein